MINDKPLIGSHPLISATTLSCAGVTMLQLAIPSMRQDRGLKNFNSNYGAKWVSCWGMAGTGHAGRITLLWVWSDVVLCAGNWVEPERAA